MSGPFRNPAGGAIEREHRYAFEFDGRALHGLRGDTLAAALLAQGVRLVGRSVKYRRPRGILSAGPEEPNALCTLALGARHVPNVPITTAMLAEGMRARSQNRWPSLRFDVCALIGVGGALFGAGFYYKTFMWPSWRCYEPLIRRLAGLGTAPRQPMLQFPGERHLHCDVLVIGAGAAGLAAAVAAASHGAKVIVCERDSLLGGELQFESGTIGGRPTSGWVTDTARTLSAGGVEVLSGTAVVGCYDEQVLALRQPNGIPTPGDELLSIRAKARILATGATERAIAFEDNDRPGVMLLGAVERFAQRFAVRAGNHAVLFANHDRVYAAALRLRAAGLRIAAIVDPRARRPLGALEELERSGVRILSEHVVERVLGRACVRGALVRALSSAAHSRIECDLIAVSGGWTPTSQLALQSQLSERYDAELAAFVPESSSDAVIPAGALAGRLELGEVIADGLRAGAAAARLAAASPASAASAPIVRADPPPALQALWRVRTGNDKRQFVDLQNDVTVRDLRQAVGEGFREIEHIKRYTTLGVGTDQGRTAGLPGAAIVAELLESRLEHVGTSRARPPASPLPLAALAGAPAPLNVRPVRHTPLHGPQLASHAVMEPAGLWLRSRYFRNHGETLEAAAVFEAHRVRNAGGLFDASTLGKIELLGPDAAACIDRLYLGRPSRMGIDRARYGVMLREDGMVLDDGLLLRLGAEHFLLTTSTHAAAAVLSHLEYHVACAGSSLAVTCTDVTDAWAVIVVAGPASRGLLRHVLPAPWPGVLPHLKHMDLACGEWDGRPLRVVRASFSGELAYELHCSAEVAAPLWESLHAAALTCGVIPYGLEALDILRIEKGYLTSAEINGQVSPFDLGLERMVSASADCIGRALLDRPALHEPQRPMLVGVVAADAAEHFSVGAQLIATRSDKHALGYVTSAASSPTLGRTVGLALLARAHARPGATVVGADPLRGRPTLLRVTAPVHLDPAGERMRG